MKKSDIDYIETVKFFETIFGKDFFLEDRKRDNCVYLGAVRPGSSSHGAGAVKRKDLEKVISRMERSPRSLTTCICTVPKPAEGSNGFVSRKENDMQDCHAIITDDNGEGDNKAKFLPFTPTYTLCTSEGNHQQVLKLDPPVRMDIEENRIRVEAVMRGLAKAGYSDAGATKTTQEFRIPGSINLKKGKNKYVTHAVKERMDPSLSWSLEALENLCTSIGAPPERRPPSRRKKALSKTLTPDYKDEVLEFLEKNNLLVGDSVGGAGYIDIECPWANEHSGPNDPKNRKAGYSPIGHGQQPYERHFHCFHDTCNKKKKRRTKHFLDWYQEKTNKKVAKKEAHTKFVKINDGRFGLLDASIPGKDCLISKAGLRNALSFSSDTVDDFIENEAIESAIRAQFVPGEPLKYYNSAGHLIFNTYRLPDHHWLTAEMPEGYAPKLVLKLLSRVAPGEHTNRMLDFIANMVQNPGNRSYAMLVIGTVGGEGKSYLGKFISALVGYHNAANCTLKELFGKEGWADFIEGTLFITVDETKDLDSAGEWHQAKEHAKRVIDTSPSRARGNFKGRNIADYYIYANYLFCSNNRDAIKLDCDDRRFYVLEAAKNLSKDPEFFAEFEAFVMGSEDYADGVEMAYTYQWFMNRQITTNLKNPPMTEEKRALLEESQGDLESEILTFARGLPGAVTKSRDFDQKVRAHFVEGALSAKESARQKAAIREVKKMFKERKGAMRVFIIRDFDRWLNASWDEIKEEAEKNAK